MIKKNSLLEREKFRSFRIVSILSFCLIYVLAGCNDRSMNNPYRQKENTQNILYSSFELRPNHLDPVRSYSSNEYKFIAQIYEPPFQYHYLKRPYELQPLTAVEIPVPVYLDEDGNKVSGAETDQEVAFSVYDITIEKGIQYQPHPAFAKNSSGTLKYQNIKASDLDKIFKIDDFERTGSRELLAADYVYQIKRLAHPGLHSPIFGIMAEYIVGLEDYAVRLKKELASKKKKGDSLYLDLNQFDLPGVSVIDRYTYRVKIKGKYPQLLYWFAMPFFAPMPQEVESFYAQPGMTKKNLTLDWYPVGTGPYMLSVNNPNRQMILEKNPNYHDDFYPETGAEGDESLGLLADAGKKLPFIEKVVFSLEKEAIPYWNKFLQGYYDASGISSDSFDQAVSVGAQGEVSLTSDMESKGIQLQTAVSSSIYYMGFNMLDPVFGGLSEDKKKLRQAISIVMNYEEFISIFSNGRGVPAFGPIPAGIFGHLEGKLGINPYVYDWSNGRAARKSVSEARQLLAEAGYENGIEKKTGKPLVINLDITAPGPDDKARLDWYRKQLQKLNIQLIVRNTDYNRFQEKMRNGKAQLFTWGWNADYPDPENFLFLLYGPNGKVKFSGENAANYKNQQFDLLFEKMKNMENSAERLSIINQMMNIVRDDSPWIWGFHPKNFSLFHSWYFNVKPNLMANNTLKYKRIDPKMREVARNKWNKPLLWPIYGMLILFSLVLVPAFVTYRRKVHTATAYET